MCAFSRECLNCSPWGENRDEGGAQIVHFTTPSGGAVFSVGSITFGSALLTDAVCAGVTGERVAAVFGW